MVRRKPDPRHFVDNAGGHGKATDDTMADRRPRKRKPTTVLREIKRLQRTTNLLIPKLPFSRLVREIIFEIFPRLGIERMQATAIEALQEAVEMYMVQFFEDAGLMAFHGKRATVMRQDIIMLRRLRGRDDIINK